MPIRPPSSSEEWPEILIEASALPTVALASCIASPTSCAARNIELGSAIVRMIAPSSPVGMPSRSMEMTVCVVERLPADAA